MSKNRSPREVCSMTDGMIRIDGCVMCCGSLTAGGPEFRLGRLLFLVGRPESLAHLGELLRNALYLGGDSVESVTEAQIVAKRLEAAALTKPEQGLVGVVANDRRLFAYERLDFVVGDLDPKPVRGGVEHELARDGARGLLAEPRDQLLGLLAGHREIRLERNASRLDLPRKAAEQLARARLDERSRGVHLRRGDDRIGDVGAELRLDFLRDLLAQVGLDVLPQLRERVELARRARELVVELGQQLLLDLLHRYGDGLGRVVGELERDLLRLAGAHADDALLHLLDD